MTESTARRLPVAVIALMGVYLIGLAWRSLGWHLYQDEPILLYAAYLIDRRHVIPYRDLFDMNMPGTYLANVIIGRWSGYADAGVRIVDLGVLGVLLAITLAAMRRFGWRSAWCATVFAGVLYLASGEWMTLQREFLLLIPIAGSVAVAWSRRVPWLWKAFIAGLLAGIAATIKPHAWLSLVVVVIYTCEEAARLAGPGRTAIVAAAVGGFVMAPLVMLWWLWHVGALPAFADVALHYWPLYTSLSGTPVHFIVSGWYRPWYILSRSALLGIHPGLPLFVAATLGAIVALYRSHLNGEATRAVWLLVGLSGSAIVHAAVEGKFWMYHWLPFDYFAILVASVGLVRQRDDAPRPRASVAAILLFLLIGLPWRIPPFATPFRFPFDEVRDISQYLSAHAKPGDTVLPLDWSEGVQHALLLARVVPATPFIYDFHFYHDVSSPYIQELRRRLLSRLEEAPPRFVVAQMNRTYFQGPDTTSHFDELARFIAGGYDAVVVRPDYQIWERRVSRGAALALPASFPTDRN
jgi:hypothetical protein